ncbi:hypothetical protein G7046_g6176 [Stylonectria norvegica]|nr:hypothetical protein G7046_g6176 [Stylonectria norvegica]
MPKRIKVEDEPESHNGGRALNDGISVKEDPEGHHADQEQNDEFESLNRGDIKRKVEDDLCFPTSKRMRHSGELLGTALSKSKFSNMSTYLSIWHNKVLHMAVVGKLINPQHFDVASTGQVVLSPLGMARVKLTLKHDNESSMVEEWNATQLSQAVPRIESVMNKGNFFQRGHASLTPLKMRLQSQKGLTLGNLHEDMLEVKRQTSAPLKKLAETAEMLSRSRDDLFGDLTRFELRSQMQDLFGSYDDRALSMNMQLVLMDPLASRDRKQVDIFQLIETRVKTYDNLFSTIENIVEESRVPGHYFSPAGEESVKLEH